MTKLKHGICLAVAASLLGTPLLAQQPAQGAAILQGLYGNVLVSTLSGLAAATEGARLAEGARVITTNRAQATVVFDDDACRVRLHENQRYEVRQKGSCADKVAAVQGILPAPSVAIVADGVAAPLAAQAGGVTLVGLSALGGIVGLGVLMEHRNDRSVSPS
jgi:hypothetical protein